MNVENDFLTDFDLFGKTPEFYYKGKSKKASTFGIILTFLYIALYITFLIYKLVRMFQRVEVTFYDSYVFNGIPSIKLTNNEFYGGFGMGGIVEPKMYWLNVTFVNKWKVNGQWENVSIPLETEICQLNKFGPDYQELFSKEHLENYYCIKDISNLVLEGYSNLERYSYFNVKFYPCVGKTPDDEDCYNDYIKTQFFTINTIELKIQDNYINPINYKTPVERRVVNMNSPVFKDLFQFIFSYLQIVNIETDEDITGLNFFTDSIRKELYMRYDESFIISSPKLYGDNIFAEPGIPIADVTVQLAAKVLTEKRQYTQLIDVLGDVGGLMEILYTVLNIISSFVTEILYDKSLVNNLFSFDLNKKYVVFNHSKIKKLQPNENITIIDNKNNEEIPPKENNKELNNNKNIEIYSIKKNVEPKIATKNTLSSKRNIKIKKRNQFEKFSLGNSKSSLSHLKSSKSHNEKIKNNFENKISSDEKKNNLGNNNLNNSSLGIPNETIISN